MSSTINVKLKFFASSREIVGSKELDMDIERGSKTKDVLNILMEKFPGLKDFEGQLILAVNKQTGKADRLLEDGDEIAVLPPVSGG
ncbi:MAG: molybdopterin converting factor subunit 1 [Candidatus Saliniplasma sp.]